MITKLLKLQGIGLLHDAVSATPDGNRKIIFEENTIIYAENGRGKSTLAAIIRSLATGDTSYIKERSTLNGKNSPSVQFLIENKPHTYSDSTWDRTYPEILIFDTHFVDTNIYCGTTVSAPQKRKLLEFAIGDTGVKLSEKINDLNEKVKTSAEKINNSENALKLFIVEGLPLEEFLSLAVDNLLGIKIDEKEKLVAALIDQERIMLARLPVPLKIEVPDALEVLELLQTSLDTLSTSAEEAVKEHNRLLLGGKGEAWLRDGLRFDTGKICPYCSQKTNAVEIVKSFQGYFSTEYEKLKRQVENCKIHIAAQFAEEKLLELVRIEATNNEAIAFWRKHIDFTLKSSPFASVENIFISLRRELKEVLEKKSAAPLEALDLPPVLQAEFSNATEVLAIVGEYDIYISDLRNRIDQFKSQLQRSDLKTAKRDLLLAKNRIVRQSSPAKDKCDEYMTFQNEKIRLEEEKAKAKDELERYTATELSEYEKGINEYLKRCGTGFKIEQVKHSYTGGVASSEYKINIKETSIKLQEKSSGDPVITFRTALSDGDKRTLAFAFFINRLYSDPNLSNKTVVFDDPLVSFDAHRRHICIETLKNISVRAKQLIVFTHDLDFAKNLSDEFKVNICTYKLRRAGGYTVIDKCDLTVESDTIYVKSYSKLKDYAQFGCSNSSDVIEIGRAIRPLLEGCLRSHFPKNFSENATLGDMLGAIRTCDNYSPMISIMSEYDRLARINDYIVQYFHDDSGRSGRFEITENELSVHVESTLEFVHRN